MNMKDINVPEFKRDSEEVVSEKNKPAKKRNPRKVISSILVIIAVLGVCGSVYFYKKYQSLKIDPNAEAAKQTASLVAQLSKLMELPQGETPTVATISDKEKLKGQSFFNLADNGDILFAYTTSMKAILYRPSTNKIINVAPISINQSQDLTGASQKVESPTLAPAVTPKKK